MDPVLCRLLDDLPVSRLFGAFERSHPTEHRLRTLFDLCLRATVPFAVVDARLQAYLPLVAPSAVVGVAGAGGADAFLEASQSLPTLLAHDKEEDRERADADDGAGDPTTDDSTPRWVSCCGCPRRTRVHRASRRTLQDYWCGGPCPCGWLRRVTDQGALRIVAWHWACLVAGTYKSLCIDDDDDDGYHDDPDEPPCRGLYEWDLERITGHGASSDYVGPGWGLGPSDAVLFELVCGSIVFPSIVTRADIDWPRQEGRGAAFRRVPHPSCHRVDVFVRPPRKRTDGGDSAATSIKQDTSLRVLAFVRDDLLFAGTIGG
ncbi:hypothetical protein pclt_cds_410 [Pandoravirus celtis]|uniref:Uncharacterized protein n=1 Tax=Pandoravirus celtis TaxID=2568002 RepID=A0A4D6EH46_9VIRU|nr:hypothetical protein pclt_cds_410 [Pandoravirus celtis]